VENVAGFWGVVVAGLGVVVVVVVVVTGAVVVVTGIGVSVVGLAVVVIVVIGGSTVVDHPSPVHPASAAQSQTCFSGFQLVMPLLGHVSW
jgi:hypothetical protein